MARWTLVAPDNTTYVFPISPNRADSLVPVNNTVFQDLMRGEYVGVNKGHTPLPWSFSGVVRDSAMYDALLSWVGRKTKVTLTTDLGEVLTVRLTTFQPDRVGPPRPAAPFRHTYTIKALVYAGP